ncbi:hypothetical protein BHE74_00010642 [Ensete ventricosum]|nr:hypothetical protein BHE74_00010642 [Ensete ventricosum]
MGLTRKVIISRNQRDKTICSTTKDGSTHRPNLRPCYFSVLGALRRTHPDPHTDDQNPRRPTMTLPVGVSGGALLQPLSENGYPATRAEAGFLGNFVPPSAAKRGFNLDGEALRVQAEVEKLSKSVSYGRFIRSLLRRWKLLKDLDETLGRGRRRRGEDDDYDSKRAFGLGKGLWRSLIGLKGEREITNST